MFRFRLTCVFAISLATAASGAEPVVSGFQSYEAPTYTLITKDESAARHFPSEIARIDSLLGTLLKPETRRNGAKTYVLLVPGGLYTRYLQPPNEFAGDFAAGRFANFLMLENNRAWPDMKARIYHEYTHWFLHTQFPGIHPFWFDEGLAVLVGNTEFRSTKAKVGIAPPESGYWMPFEQLLRIDKASPEYTLFTTLRVQNESWAMVHRGLIAEPEFGKHMLAYLKAIDDLRTIDEAVPASFGMSIEQLDRSMMGYRWSDATLSIVTPNILPTSPVDQQPGNTMSELEMLELLAAAMMTSGFNSQRLHELVDAANRLAPGSPTADVLRLRLAVRDRDDAALERLLQEIEPRVTAPAVARGLGLALFERLRADEAVNSLPPATRERFQLRAFELLRASAGRQADDIEAVWAYAMLAASLRRDLNSSLDALFKVQRQLPGNADLAMAAARLHEARGETQDMIRALGETFRSSSKADQRAWAKTRLAALHAIAGQ
jgi:hypothetical protein